MAYYVVTYDLVKDKDYEKLIGELKEMKAERVALSVWLLERYQTTAFGLRNHFKKFIDGDDKLIVIEFEKEPAYTIAFTTGANWITARFGSAG